MRNRNIWAVLTPFLFAAAPAMGQQRPAPAPAPKPAAAAVAARPLQLEITGGLGITAVDVNTWAGRSANDWGTLAYWGAARLLFPVGATLRVGVEAGYAYHFWYNYYPGGVSWVYEYSVSATHVAGLIRLPLGPRVNADLGAGMHFFDGATKIGALGALSYDLVVGNLVIPIGVRADLITTNPTLVPVVLKTGVRFSL